MVPLRSDFQLNVQGMIEKFSDKTRLLYICSPNNPTSNQMKVEDIRAMTDDQREDAVLNLKKERFNLRFQRATGQLENTSRMKEARRDIARIKTVAAQVRAKKK